MQFSELSELNYVVGLLRSGGQNSSSFHDRHDSEIDRLFNSSPQIQADGMIGLGDVNHGGTSTTLGVSASRQAGTDTGEDKSGTGTEGGARGVGKPGCKVVVFDMEERKKDAFKTQKEVFQFTKFPIETVQNPVGCLGNLLFGKEEGAKKSVGHGVDAPMLQLTIYLPNRGDMAMELSEVSTVEESIDIILRIHKSENRSPPLYYGHPECYELRLHDQDGFPDEDFPALDRSRKIKNFGDAGGHEYCLCERPDSCPPPADSPTTSEKNRKLSLRPLATRSKVASSNASEQSLLKIYMPNDDYTVVAIDHTTTGQDLLPTLNKKHRLQLFKDEYILKLNEADRERLDRASDEIDLTTKLKALGVQELTLSIKKYADAPQILSKVTSGDAADTKVSSATMNARPDLESFMFNDVTAATYKEWLVLKKNKYGKKQSRIIGVDIEKVYNKKVGEHAIRARTNTKNAERPIHSIASIDFLDERNEFRIVFVGTENLIIDYTAETPYECAEIVAKIKYLINSKK